MHRVAWQHGGCVRIFAVVGAASSTSIMSNRCRNRSPYTVQTPAKCASLSERFGGRVKSQDPEQSSFDNADMLFDKIRASVASIYVVEVIAGQGPNVGRACAVDLEHVREADVTFLGSGYVFGDGNCVATCAHLFEGKKATLQFIVRFGDGRMCAAELRGSNAAADVAVLGLVADRQYSDMASSRPPLVLQASQTTPRQGERVAVCGWTQHGRETVALIGMVSQPRQSFRGLAEEPATHFIQIALPTLPGMSGSPVVNSNGELVAMMAKKFEEHGLALPAARVAAFAQCLEQGLPCLPPVLGLELEAAGSLLEPGVAVRAVQPDSPAAIAGIAVGDRIEVVEEQAVNTILDVREAISMRGATAALANGKKASNSERMTLTVRMRLRRAGSSRDAVIAANLPCR